MSDRPARQTSLLLPSARRGAWSRRGLVAVAWIRRRHAALALTVFTVAAVVIERDAVTHLGSVCACNAGSDPTQFMWAFVWWPYAMLHGLNPFVPHLIWIPQGVNLAAATSVPAAAIVATPLTALWGPVVAFNLLSIFAPVLSAFAAYRLCLYITHEPAPAIVAGFVYGFCSFELSHLSGLLHLVFLFPAPLAVLLTLKRIDGVIGQGRYVWQMALVLLFQLLLSTELFLTMLCMGGVCLIGAYILGSPDLRIAIRRTLPGTAISLAIVLAASSPYMYYAITDNVPYSVGWDRTFSADVLSFVVPTPIALVGGHSFAAVANAFLGNLTEGGTYLGIPLVVAIAVVAIQRWARLGVKLVVIVLAVAGVWSLGPRMLIDGHSTIWLPWSIFSRLPLFDQMLPIRLAVYVALAASVMLAWLLADWRSNGVLRWVLAALAIAFLLPNTSATYPGTSATLFHGRLDQPTFFTTTLYRRYLPRNAIVLPLPFGSAGVSLLWQARTDMWFRMASGYFGNPPPSYARDPFVSELLNNLPGPLAAQQLRAFLVQRHVQDIVADPQKSSVWLPVLSKAGLRGVTVGGVTVYHVPVTRS